MRKNSSKIMGILNLTPDSFSDGGEHNTLQTAIRRVKDMEKEGADMIDIGGESTGPGSKDVKLEEELNRVIPVLKEIRKITKLPISIDTYKAEVARQALEEGADIINDVTALRGDNKLAETVGKYKCPVVLMYSKDKTPRTTVKEKKYKDVIQTIKEFLEERISYAKSNGIKEKNIIIDPGMGQFISALPKYSYEIIARLNELEKIGRPVLVGLSRKSFLGGPLSSRLQKALPLTAIAHINGASIIRTHDIATTKAFIKQVS